MAVERPPAGAPMGLGFLLTEGYGLMGTSSAIDPFHMANQVTAQRLYDWEIITADGAPTPASNGLTLVPSASLQDIAFLPYVFVSASYGCETIEDRQMFAWLRQLYRHGATIGALALGSYVLARAGLLKDHRCTIHWQTRAAFSEDFPALQVTSRLFEVDRRIMTSAGGGATFDMMLHLIAEHHGQDLAMAVAEQLIHPMPDAVHAHQRMPLTQRLGISHPKLIGIVELMEANLEEPLKREDLADRVGLSTRQVERLFETYLGRPPARYYLELRLKRAHLLLCQTSLPILDVSVACGFVSASHFSKSYRDFFGHSPRHERAPRAARAPTPDAVGP